MVIGSNDPPRERSAVLVPLISQHQQSTHVHHDTGLNNANQDTPELADDNQLTHSDNRNRTAIVWVCRYLDACGAARLRHLLATSTSRDRDVWVLHNHKSLKDQAQLQTSQELLGELQSFAKEKLGVRLYSLHQDEGKWNGFDGDRSRSSKSSFLKFVVQQQYGWAWHLEDDVFYTGPWREILDSTLKDGTEQQYDIVATGSPAKSDWYYFRSAKCAITVELATDDTNSISQKPRRVKRFCVDVDRTMIRWAILRVSYRFAKTLVDQVPSKAIEGHHEAVVASVCAVYGYQCTLDVLKPYIGHVVTAGWGDWMDPQNQTLERHGDSQPHKIYHPVKCAAYSSSPAKLTQQLVYQR
ncbi:expressed unknown protein [Seminavis robusta]|uniref:Uncharacterized protein n=1 Tax=Seminavis robusta TaxID=568900 RepID=A0A9N8EY85_9STRA|nr:expressed unknown protein [Seminavis robusta]|eukprot:Sro2061_g313020.1 n/a (355) ;mRNA; r:17360-18424